MTVFTLYRGWIISFFTALLLAVSTVGGYYYFLNKRHTEHLLEASHNYEQWIQNMEKTPTIPLEQASEFIKQYADTPYAALVQLQLAKQAVQHNQLKAAIEWLKMAADNTRDTAIRAISKQRGARILSTLGEFKEALKWLDEINCEDYAASTEEMRGDILLSSGQKEQALRAYHRACEIDPVISTLNPFLSIKIADLGAL